jgi:eukaryotic-like serine/threonine-protein kinase
MDPDRWQLVGPYLDQALDIADAGARAEWLTALRARAPEMAGEVEALLAEHRALAQDSFLEKGSPWAPGPVTVAGQRIGDYTLRTPIGQGGMGTVWLADRSDGRFDRRAAVKLLNLGLSGRVEDRFKREGSLLARLTHPRIAQLFDAGVSTTGPYLILEYVDGKPVDQYCDEHALAVDDRVRLFLEILDAVAHAHVNLIVHRDIKPSNVLVGNDGHVKLLDFGIAKLLGDDPSGEASLTREGGAAMTPQFAAPEQITGGVVTTATDVYALGVLLFVMLTGRHPHGAALRSTADLVKAVVETDPGRPSDAVVGPAVEPAEGANNAAKRSTTADKLRRALSGDLDTIVGKALKKDPLERYVSVTALADDLRRYLQQQPISARPDSVAYRAGKFVRRNRLPVAAAMLAIAALSAGLFELNRQRVIAERRFSQLRHLSKEMFEVDRSIGVLPGSTDARRRIVSASLEYLEGLSADASSDLALTLELADAYNRTARVQGVPTDLNLGDFAKAEQSLIKANNLTEIVLASRPRDTAALFRSASIAHDRMILAESEGRRADALVHAQKAKEQLNALPKGDGLSATQLTESSQLRMNIALAYSNMHRYEDSAVETRQSLAIARTIPSNESRVASGLSLLANALRFQGDLDGARRAIEEAREVTARATSGDRGVQTLNAYGVLLREGLIKGEDGGVSLDEPLEAIIPLQKAFDTFEALARQDPIDSTTRTRVGTSGRELGNILRHTDPPRALGVYDVAIGRLGEIKNNVRARRDLAIVLANSAYPLRRLHRSAEAGQRIERATKILNETKDLPADRVALDGPAFAVLRATVDHLDGEGDREHALVRCQQLLAQVMLSAPDPQNDLRDANSLSLLYLALSSLYARSGDPTRAEALVATRLELWRRWERKLPGNPFVLRQLAVAGPHVR